MAVSLVSTGVQFPDSTIQTTAAAAAPSATVKGAVIITNGTVWSPGTPLNGLVTLGSNNVFTTAFTSAVSAFPQAYQGSVTLTSCFYSSYYNGWFGMIGAVQNVTSYNRVPAFSPDGLTWNPIFFSSVPQSGPFNYSAGGGVNCLGVNDSNGTLYIMTGYNGDSYIYYSTNLGSTWTQSMFVGTNYYYSYTQAPTFRYINTGTASTSRSVFTVGNSTNGIVCYAAGNSNTFAAAASPTIYPNNTTSYQLPANVCTYGSLLGFRSGTNVFSIYNAATDTVGAEYFGTLGIDTSASIYTPMAISTSYWMARYASQGYVAYGTISGGTPIVGGAVLLPRFTNATYEPRILGCVYDGTRWMAITDQGMFYTTNASPGSGWTRAGVNLGNVNFPDTTYGNNLMVINQRDALYS